jgi:DNA-binding transcriptional LysR family regulator
VRLLRTFITVIDEGGFSRAAKALHVTQPTISQHVQRLESMLRTPLFHRVGRTPRLTPAGREVEAHARRVVLLNDEVLATVSTIGSEARC